MNILIGAVYVTLLVLSLLMLFDVLRQKWKAGQKRRRLRREMNGGFGIAMIMPSERKQVEIELGGKTYRMRQLSVGDFRNLIAMVGDTTDPHEVAQSLSRQVSFLLRDGDGLAPTPEEVDEVPMSTAMELLNRALEPQQR